MSSNKFFRNFVFMTNRMHQNRENDDRIVEVNAQGK